jgi:hypothetical protein
MPDQLSPDADTYLDALHQLARALYKTPLARYIEKSVKPCRIHRVEDIVNVQRRHAPKAAQT